MNIYYTGKLNYVYYVEKILIFFDRGVHKDFLITESLFKYY
jgi:hypothetical protein